VVLKTQSHKLEEVLFYHKESFDNFTPSSFAVLWRGIHQQCATPLPMPRIVNRLRI